MTKSYSNGQSAPTMPTAPPRSFRARLVSRVTKWQTIAFPELAERSRAAREDHRRLAKGRNAFPRLKLAKWLASGATNTLH